MARIVSCRVCGSRSLRPFFDLGKHPIANALLQSPRVKEKFFHLALVWCPTCNLAQLDYTVDPKVLFSHYVWVTGTSKGAKDFSKVFYKEFVKRTLHAKTGYVLEVASNDGTFLKPFMAGGFKVLGVDPAKNVVAIAKKAGVPTVCEFWGTKAARQLVKKRGKAHMIFARNVVAHVAGTLDFAKGLAHAIDDGGVVAVEPHYAGSIQQGGQYDSIYHEHLCYFTLKPLEHLLRGAGLHVFDLKESPISGGAIIVYASKKKRPVSAKLKKYRQMESRQKTNSLTAWQRFARTAREHRARLLKLLKSARAEGELVVGWGASARSSTMLNFAGIGPSLIKEIADKNPLKHNLYTAGTHIQVKAPEQVLKQNPEYVVILGWNFAQEIIAELKSKFQYKGKILVPLPGSPKVLRAR